MKPALIIFFAQLAAHTIWYLDVRAAQVGRAYTAVFFDICYGLLSIYAFKYVLDPKASRSAIFAYVAGGAIGTFIGVRFPL